VELLPELLDADPWGYPIIREPTVDARLERYAGRAVTLCPRLALRLVE
jgi:ferredoxin